MRLAGAVDPWRQQSPAFRFCRVITRKYGLILVYFLCHVSFAAKRIKEQGNSRSSFFAASFVALSFANWELLCCNVDYMSQIQHTCPTILKVFQIQHFRSACLSSNIDFFFFFSSENRLYSVHA